MQNDTKKHITLLKNLLKGKANSILEIQCGDGYDIENCKALQDSKLNYIGVDVVDGVIQDNRQYFRNEKNKIFMILDASNEPLPKTDLVVCTGMAEYLPIANIWSLLENIRDSQAKYFAFDFYSSPIDKLKINDDIQIDDGKKAKKRAVNLSQAPFYFPSPMCLFPTDEANKFVALYEIKDVSFFMDWHNDDVSYLRANLFGYLDSDFDRIKNVFEKYDNGAKLWKDATSAETLDWNKFYYDEPYKTIVDSNNMFTDYIDFLILLYKNGKVERLHADNHDRYKDLITEDNFLQASIIAKDFVRWKYGELF